MSNYNFREFFDNEYQKVMHNENYISNGHFLLNKSILKKSQLDFINQYSQNDRVDSLVKNILTDEPDTLTEFIPTKVMSNESFVMIYNGVYLGVNIEYYNFVKANGCYIYIINDSTRSPYNVYNADNEWIGVILPVRVNPSLTNELIDITDYNARLQEQEREEELRKERQKKCLYISDNKAIVRNKELTCITDIVKDKAYKNLYVEADYMKNFGEVYVDFGFVCMFMGRTIDKNDDVEYIKEKLEFLLPIDFDYYKNYITDCLNNMKFINVAEIKLMELSGESEEYIQKLIEHRQKVLDIREHEHKEWELKRQQEDQELVNTENKKAYDTITAAEQAIIDNKMVANRNITIYKAKYDSNTTSLILYLMKQYGINVPLKTQGWINNALANIFFDSDNLSWTYQYYTSSKDSTVFTKYLNHLVNCVKEKYQSVA
jgi:hypothetical protein